MQEISRNEVEKLVNLADFYAKSANPSPSAIGGPPGGAQEALAATGKAMESAAGYAASNSDAIVGSMASALDPGWIDTLAHVDSPTLLLVLAAAVLVAALVAYMVTSRAHQAFDRMVEKVLKVIENTGLDVRRKQVIEVKVPPRRNKSRRGNRPRSPRPRA